MDNKDMKKILTMIFLAASIGAWAQDRSLNILHTNDTHSTVLPLNANLADTAVADRGGYVRRMELVRRERLADPELLLLDSGDFSQGSPYYSLFHGEVEVGLMNMMKYDACTIGNHEFDSGMENMAKLFRMAKFPIVCANYDFTGTPVEGLVKPYVVLKRKGVRVGIFGLSPDPHGLIVESGYKGMKFLDPIATANEMVKILRGKEKCDVVICLSHLGIDEDPNDDRWMLRSTRGIDLVLGGHSHSYLKQLEYEKDLDGKPVPIDQNGKHAIWVGKLRLDFAKKK